jgi:5-methylcytosine-specific restriction endonuclease McrA
MATYDEDRIELVFDRTDGRCHICWGKLVFSNYGRFGERGAWEIEHSNPRCKGGSDRLSNLFAAHITCNREKGTMHTRTARAWNDRTRAPLSRQRRIEKREENTLAGAGIGAISGALLGGPVGLFIGGIAGAAIGNGIEPE